MTPFDLESRIAELTQAAGLLERARYLNMKTAIASMEMGDLILDDLDLLLPQFLEDRPLPLAWEYWIGRLEAEDFRVYVAPGIEPVIASPNQYEEIEIELEELGYPDWEIAQDDVIPENKTILDLIAKLAYSGIYPLEDRGPTASGLTLTEARAMTPERVNAEVVRLRELYQSAQAKGRVSIENQAHMALKLRETLAELNLLVVQWSQDRAPGEIWAYWINRLEALGYRAYFDGEVEFEIRSFLDSDFEGPTGEIADWFLAEPGKVPGEYAITQLIQIARGLNL